MYVNAIAFFLFVSVDGCGCSGEKKAPCFNHIHVRTAAATCGKKKNTKKCRKKSEGRLVLLVKRMVEVLVICQHSHFNCSCVFYFIQVGLLLFLGC